MNTDDPPPLDCWNMLVTPDIVSDRNFLHTDVKKAGDSGVRAVDITSVDLAVQATDCINLWCYKNVLLGRYLPYGSL
jgi:hypothetical protein